MSSKYQQKGNVLLIVIILVGALIAGLYYMYGQRIQKVTSTPQNDYTLGTDNPATGSGSVEGTATNLLSTSSKMTLTLTSPKNNSTLNSQVVTVSGKTSANAEVFVNDQSTKADGNGNFILTVTLDKGENSMVVTANDSDGNVVEQNLSVNVQTF